MAMPPWIRTQLSNPHGWLAEPMAWLLNRRNRSNYKRALNLLAVQPGEHVLELGFGGGLGLKPLLAAGAIVTAADPAVAMRARALRKHYRAVAEGRLVVVDARSEALPEGPFDAAISMNTVYFWTDVPASMAELRRACGRVVLGIASTKHLQEVGFSESGFRVEPAEWYGEALTQAGFKVRLERADGGSAFLVGVVPTAIESGLGLR